MSTPAPISSFRVRPRFEDTLDLSPENTRQLSLQAFARHAPNFEVKAFPGYICQRIPVAERNFWSPPLTLSPDPTPQQTTPIEFTFASSCSSTSRFYFEA